MTAANKITLGRILAIPLIIGLMSFRLYGLAAICFVLVAFSDALDGYLARRFGEVTEFGKFFDPLADKVLVIVVLVALVDHKLADPIPVMLIVARVFLVSGIRIAMARSQIIISASPLAKVKTTIQLLAVLMLILKLPYAGVILWLAVALSLMSGWAYLWQSKILDRLR